LETLEQRIQELETLKQIAESSLMEAGSDFTRLDEASSKIKMYQEELDLITERWMALEEKKE
jgi:hypothetical protein